MHSPRSVCSFSPIPLLPCCQQICLFQQMQQLQQVIVLYQIQMISSANLKQQYFAFKKELLTMMIDCDPLQIIQSDVFDKFQKSTIFQTNIEIKKIRFNQQNSFDQLSSINTVKKISIEPHSDNKENTQQQIKTSEYSHFNQQNDINFANASFQKKAINGISTEFKGNLLNRLKFILPRLKPNQIPDAITKIVNQEIKTLEFALQKSQEAYKQTIFSLQDKIKTLTLKLEAIGDEAVQKDKQLLHLLKEKQLNKKLAETKAQLEIYKVRSEKAEQQLRKALEKEAILTNQREFQKQKLKNHLLSENTEGKSLLESFKDRIEFENVRRNTFLEFQRMEMNLQMKSQIE